LTAPTEPLADRPPLALIGAEQRLRPLLQRIEAQPQRMAELLADAGYPAIVFDPSRRILFANAGAEAFFGHGPGALNGAHTDVLLPERLHQPDAPPIKMTGDLMQVDLPGLRRDGAELLVEWTLGSLKLEGRDVFVMMVQNRNEIDRAVEALRASEERFRLLVEGVRDCAIFMLDANGVVSSWNPGATRIQGWSSREVIGQPYELFFSHADRAAGVPRKILDAALAAGSYTATGWRVRKDDTLFWTNSSLTVLRGEKGELRGFATVTRDLTDRLHAEENERRLLSERAAREAAQAAEMRIRASEERLRRLQRVTAALSEASTPEEVCAVVLRECLPAMAADGGSIYAVAPDGAMLTRLGQSGALAPPFEMTSLALAARTPLTDAARERRAGFFESRVQFCTSYPEIDPGPFSAGAAVPLVAHGTLFGLLFVRFHGARSFSPGDRAQVLSMAEQGAQALERATLYVAESQARAQAESANRAKDEFLAVVSHELRTPLNAITGWSRMMMTGTLSAEKQRHAIEVIDRNVKAQRQIIDDLLDISRIVSGQVRLNHDPVEPAQIVEMAVEAVRPAAEAKEVRLAISIEPDIGPLLGDSDRLQQVIWNLLTNAVKFTPKGGLVQVRFARQGAFAEITVEDNGQGISAEFLPYVFDRFRQADATSTRAKGGLGIGLAIVRHLVELHEGTVSASSPGLGRGAKFVVRLPLARAETSRFPLGGARGPITPGPSIAALGAASPGLKGVHILIVDDEPDARDMLSAMLGELHVEVSSAGSAQEALEMFHKRPPAILISDIGMPGEDGYSLIRKIRALDPSQGGRTPAVALTAYARPGDRTQALRAGFDMHVPKPVDAAELVVVLANLQARQASAAKLV